MLAAMPVLNQQNIFSNPAMAQEYDNYGDSYYSPYPTDDKKYECRTGPFEGGAAVRSGAHFLMGRI